MGICLESMRPAFLLRSPVDSCPSIRKGSASTLQRYPKTVPPLIECVPNFSEGRDPAILQALEQALLGALILGHESDPDHNRSVFTIAGPPTAILEAIVRAAIVAAESIDLTKHKGVHPRIGAADVIPFIPLAGATMADCITLANETAQQVWQRARVPSYLYEFAARRPERTNLEAIRKIGFEALSHRPDLPPDVGGPALHPTAGACAIGARRILIACNVNLDTNDLQTAKHIAKMIRTSSGGLPYVKALGLALPSKGLVQVSMNLTHYEVTSLKQVFGQIRKEAPVHSTEIVGFPPLAALAGADDFLKICDHWNEHRILENRIAELS